MRPTSNSHFSLTFWSATSLSAVSFGLISLRRRFQHAKIIELVAEYYADAETLEAGKIKGIPRWMQWGIGDSIAQVPRIDLSLPIIRS